MNLLASFTLLAFGLGSVFAEQGCVALSAPALKW